MNPDLDTHFKQWLSEVAQKWEVDIEQTVQWLGGVGHREDEIENREIYYPQLRNVLSETPFNIQKFAQVANSCWALGERFNRIRFTQFVGRGDMAVAAIQQLIDKLPNEDSVAQERIDNFVAEAVSLGYTDKSKGGADWSGAALLASIILTALYPYRFVDYRQTRWKNLAQTFQYNLPKLNASYGEQIIWAGKFATELARTETFQNYWSKANALWTIAGICWLGPDPKKPVTEPPLQVSFPEGDKKQKWHEYRERNSEVIRLAKKQAYKRDPLLRCEACTFSFVEHYGQLGHKFIEAHHKVPIASLKPGSRTRVEDIALLCANCHRMIHSGERTLSVDEVIEIISVRKKH
jgi:hypothetical protein